MGAFNTRTLRCVGTVDGNACAQTFEIDQCAPDAKEKLEFLHLDHEQPVHLPCAWWTYTLSPSANGAVAQEEVQDFLITAFDFRSRDPPLRMIRIAGAE